MNKTTTTKRNRAKRAAVPELDAALVTKRTETATLDNPCAPRAPRPISARSKDSPSRMRAAATTICHSSAEADIIIGNPRGGFAVNVRQT